MNLGSVACGVVLSHNQGIILFPLDSVCSLIKLTQAIFHSFIASASFKFSSGEVESHDRV